VKTLFRLLVTTAVAAGCLYVLREAQIFFTMESLLGPTVDRVVELCFLALGAATVLIWFFCSVGFLVDAIRWLIRRQRAKKQAKNRTGVLMTIGAPEEHRLYDDQQETAEEAAAAKK
jgi:hypothetical protein